MGKKKRKHDEPAAAETIPETPPQDPQGDSEEASSGREDLERERDEYLANWQRARADFQNLRRRTLEEIEAAVSRERSTLLEETLTVLDYLDMALASPCKSSDAQNLQRGVEMTRDQLWSLLERQAVAPISTDGRFDPALHQAVSTVETTECEPGSVVDVVRKGYTIGDRVLRHAQVRVAAAPKEAAPEEASAGEADEGREVGTESGSEAAEEA